MVTIKEIAKEAGVSPSTVSIVLGGKSEERKIPEVTQTKIFAIAQKLGYRVNVAARRLRANYGAGLMISVFMAIDKRAYMMTRFLQCLQSAAAESGQAFELVVHSYKSGTLHEIAETISLTTCAIICNASPSDLEFLENTQFSVPIVLFLRESKKYHSANMNLSAAGEFAASVFARHGKKNAIFLDTETYYSGMTKCADNFKNTAQQHGISVTRIRETHDMQGGYNGGIIISKLSPLPDCLFAMSDIMSIGAMRAFNEAGIIIPEQMEIITLGVDTPGFEEYTAVPLSAMNVPAELLAKKCLNILLRRLAGKTAKSIEIPVEFIPRKSCGV